MAGFVKLHTSILQSTLWFQNPDRWIFVTALLLAMPKKIEDALPQLEVDSLTETGWTVEPGYYGFCETSGPGLLSTAGIDFETGIPALKRLGSPELESRSPEHDGRRLVRVSGGYVVLNYDKYREKDNTAAERMRRYRDRKREDVTRNVTSRRHNVTHAEAEAEAEADIISNTIVLPEQKRKGNGKVKSEPKPTDEEWLKSLESNLAYKTLDIPIEYAKAEAWCKANKRICSQRFVINWLNRAEKSMNVKGVNRYEQTSARRSSVPFARTVPAYRNGVSTEDDSET